MLKKDRNGQETLKLVNFQIGLRFSSGTEASNVLRNSSVLCCRNFSRYVCTHTLLFFPFQSVTHFPYPKFKGREYDGRLIDAYSAGVFLLHLL